MKSTYEKRYGHKRSRQANGNLRKEQRHQDAVERNAAWNKLTIIEKIAVLLERPGNCKKQLGKLYKSLNGKPTNLNKEVTNN